MKNTIFEYIIFITTVILVMCRTSDGQTLYDPEERLAQYGARAGSFAGAYVSEIYDISGMYWNPASISHVQKKAVVWNYLQEWGGKAKTELLAFPLITGYTTTIAVGVNATQLFVPDNFNTKRIGSVYGIDCAAGFKLIPTLSAGFLISGKHYMLKNSADRSISSSIGLLYAPSPEISYGILFSGIGDRMIFEIGSDSVRMKRNQLPKRLHLGLTMRFPSSRSERIISIVLTNDKTFGQSGIRYNGALELSLTEFLDLRTGYVVSPTYAGAKYGIGTRTGSLQFDYALSPSTSTNRFHEFTFSVFL